MIILYIFAIIFIATPFLPATGNPHWFFRTADFVRLQSIAIEIILIGLFMYFGNFNNTFDVVLFIGLIGATMYQLVKVFRYSSLFPRRKTKAESDGRITILAANVLQTNTNYKGFVNLINKYDADIVLAMETNTAWDEGLKEIESIYPHRIKATNEKFYGMLLYSKKPIEEAEVSYVIEDHVPSIHFQIQVGAENIFFQCLHPAPPSPTENETSKERDAELIISAKKLKDIQLPIVVLGDMNDVVWSRVTRLFKKITSMIDPRIGRGFFSTYHAGYSFMRFPLDHLFHTEDLFVDKMERSENFGSDHFAMFYEIKRKKKVVTTPDPKLHEEDIELIDTIIERVETE
ncbi:endonuclease/exonuclease/phosphatase family protein [Patiriisocius marinus]|uniref:Endonuclease n=1 Tax=Patiriisocius marinus TaxID=1397112 RepID=A0A5J4IM91_9FLAO|nr:endonuclease/exonuclease/phosphatase family protein [Patiriisocius marinus]GER58265.1 endonuclease [Patiriisocius marinus]